MSWIGRDFECSVETCGYEWAETIRRSEDTGTRECPECGGEAIKVFRTVPNGMFRALPDGTDRGDVYRKLKEADRINREMIKLPHDQHGEHQKQIKELKKI